MQTVEPARSLCMGPTLLHECQVGIFSSASEYYHVHACDGNYIEYASYIIQHGIHAYKYIVATYTSYHTKV